LPIVNMKDVGRAKPFRRFNHRAAEQRKTLGIIWIVAPAITVKPVAKGKFRMIDKIELHSVLLAAIHDLAEEEVVLHRDREVRDDDMFLLESCLLVSWKEDGYIMAERRDSFGQGAHHISESPGFGVRNAFRRGEGDSHPELLGFAVRPAVQKTHPRRCSEDLRFLHATEQNLQAEAKVRV